MIKKYGIILLLLISSLAQAQLMEKIKTRSKGGDPANPTSLFTRYDSHFALRFDSKFYHIGNLWSLAYAFNKKQQVGANALLAFSSKSDKVGIGDIELRYATMPYLDSSAIFSAFGFNLVAQLPSGSLANDLGIGAFRITPGVIANFKFTKWFFIVPDLRYIFTSKIVQSVPESTVNNSLHGIDAAMRFVFKPTKSSWLWLTPALTSFDLSNSTTDFELEILYGWIILNRIGLTASFSRNFTTDAYLFQFINSIYF